MPPSPEQGLDPEADATRRRLAQRYGRERSKARRLSMIVGVGALAAVGLAWLAWVAWVESTPDVTSELIGFTAVSEHEVEVTVRVELRDGVEASCRVIAQSEDHTPVGEKPFTPTDGVNQVTIRTERLATAVEKVGCTSPDQRRAR